MFRWICKIKTRIVLIVFNFYKYLLHPLHLSSISESTEKNIKSGFCIYMYHNFIGWFEANENISLLVNPIISDDFEVLAFGGCLVRQCHCKCISFTARYFYKGAIWTSTVFQVYAVVPGMIDNPLITKFLQARNTRVIICWIYGCTAICMMYCQRYQQLSRERCNKWGI